MTGQRENSPLRFGFPGEGIVEPTHDPLPLTERVAAKILARQAAAAPDRNFVFCNGGWITYGEADKRASKAANALSALGVKKGHRVAVLLRNRLEYLDLWFGLSRIGAVQVPVNVDYKAPQIVHVLGRAPVDLVVTERDFGPGLDAARRELSRPPRTLTLGRDGSEVGVDAAAHDWSAMFEEASAELPGEAESVSGADLGVIMNTSGTTGPSKGVMLSHAQQYILARNIAADLELTSDDVYYNCFPLFHNTAQAMIALPVLLVGARMVLVERFSASRFWPETTEHRCTAFYYLGETLRILLKTSAAADAARSELRIGWGIGAAPADSQEFQQRYRVSLRGGYGSTEANVPCIQNPGVSKPGSVGRAIPGFEIRIANEFGEPVPAGTQGEILIRSSEPYAVMLGYDGDPGATVKAWKDLWFHSGDAGVLDEDGDLYFKGRVNDAIRVRGENVSAFEVEQAIGQIEGVIEVAAVAVPCELGGDDIKVVVVLAEGLTIDPERIIEAVASTLPRFAVPRYVEFTDSLPKTPTNKVQRHVLRGAAFTPHTWDRLAADPARSKA